MSEPVKHKTEIQTRRIKEIVFDKSIYDRFEPDQQLISQYAENAESILESGAKIEISQNNILIDGYHRLKAFDQAFGSDFEISCIVYLTDDIRYIKLKSFSANKKHGKQNTKDEIRQNVIDLYNDGFKVQTIKKELSLSKDFVYRTLKNIRSQEIEDRNIRVVLKYLNAWNTQSTIAEEIGVDRSLISKIVEDDVKNSQVRDIHTPHNEYNYWIIKDKHCDSLKYFPVSFLEDILYYHSEPKDIIFEPYGNPDLIDVCKRHYRRYCIARETERPGDEYIVPWSVKTGLPDGMPKPDLAIVDDARSDNCIETIKAIAGKRANKIAFISTSFTTMFDVYKILSPNYKNIMRYTIEYPNGIYTREDEATANDRNQVLNINRDILVMQLTI